jgi:hypothetical protein
VYEMGGRKDLDPTSEPFATRSSFFAEGGTVTIPKSGEEVRKMTCIRLEV